jgi:heptosyltransferase-2
MDKVLLIKTGAAGDVVRTTSLLGVLAAEVYWVIGDAHALLLPGNKPGLHPISISKAFELARNTDFRHIISLEEDRECARLAREARSTVLSGIYLDTLGQIQYTDDSAHWFDMSRISKLGLRKANELKKANTQSYQHHIFRVAGLQFRGEPCQVFQPDEVHEESHLIGIEKRTGEQWPDKQWHGYDALADRLRKDGWKINIFQQRPSVRDYIRDIASCRHVISGDSLAMHLALATKRSCTAIFNCTSPQEIYDYGLLNKVVSPLLDRYFYSTRYDRESIESIPVEEVYQAILSRLK